VPFEWRVVSGGKGLGVSAKAEVPLPAVALGVAEQLHDKGFSFPTRSLAGSVEGFLTGQPVIPELAPLK